MFKRATFLVLLALSPAACTRESAPHVAQSFQTWSGANGVLDILGGDKILYRFIKIEKLTTATATNDPNSLRPYRFGYGVMDKNFNYKQDDDEKKVYFEVSNYSTNYVFYENPYED